MLGLGISNLPLTEYLVRLGAKVSVRDKKIESEFDTEIIQKLKYLASQLRDISPKQPVPKGSNDNTTVNHKDIKELIIDLSKIENKIFPPSRG